MFLTLPFVNQFFGEVLNENQLIRKENEVHVMFVDMCVRACVQKFGIIHFNLVGFFSSVLSPLQKHKVATEQNVKYRHKLPANQN